jgi:DNA-binding response OmpR family regulator
MLEDLGYAVYEAGSTAEAIDIAEQARIDILVTDLGLPDRPGTELAAVLREQKPDLVIVYASGHDEGSVGLLPGAVIVTKPYGMAELEKALASAMIPSELPYDDPSS